MLNRALIAFACTIWSAVSFGQTNNTPFQRGVNLTNWFQADDVRSVQLYKYSPETFQQIRTLGCDVVRVPINLHPMCGPAPGYDVPQLLLQFLDSVAQWSARADVQVIFDNHTFDPSENTDPNVEHVLSKAWPQIARHFLGRADHVYFEILNEPHGIALQTWSDIQGRVIDSIRTVDPHRSIIVGAANWNSFHDLQSLPDYDDPNLIYTFHFYEPFLMTHQGATWVEPSMDKVRGIPFPYRAQDMPAVPGEYAGTWIEGLYNSYPSEASAAKVRELIDIAVSFQQQRNVPVFCGEFGVYQPYADEQDRNAWYEIVRTEFEEHQIAWTMWDYHGGFGIFDGGGQGLFDHDLNIGLIEALGMTAPPQSPFMITPDKKGFTIYDDFIGSGIEYTGYNSGGQLDLYDEQAHRGQFCIEWTNPGQYSHIGFNFRPDKDLTTLVEHGYHIEFAVKGNAQGTPFDIRFVDTKVDEQDHPWRMRFVCDDKLFARNGEWHEVSIPLDAFVEHGSWDNNTWYNPEGLFDWSAIDRFEIVAEYPETGNGTFQFDDIRITDGTSTGTPEFFGRGEVRLYPNPATSAIRVETVRPVSGFAEILSFEGVTLRKKECATSLNVEIDVDDLPPGKYILHRVDQEGISIGLVPFIKI